MGRWLAAAGRAGVAAAALLAAAAGPAPERRTQPASGGWRVVHG